MAKLISKPSIDEDGPWLIARESFLELEEILNINPGKNGINSGEPTDEENSADPATSRSSLSSRVDLDLSGNRVLRAASFSEAFSDQHLIHDTVRGVHVEVEEGDVRCEFSIDPKSQRLSLRITPEGNERSNQLYVLIDQWIRNAAAPKWQQFWRNHSLIIALVVLALTLLATSMLQSRRVDFPKIKKAHALLKDGLQKNEETKATELVLAILSRYEMRKEGAIPKHKLYLSYAIMALGVFFGIALIAPPKVVIGVGKGTRRLQLWRRWIKFLSVSVPACVLLSIVIPLLLGYLKA